ncbi:MAG: ABC transporter ATP-binding protein [Opitutales bacterium]|jgi:ABC-2 type transport system ATP-binding protein
MNAGGKDRPTIIDVRGITKKFADKTVVNNVDMCVREGQIYGFLGPNGSGKTTFIRMLCGLLTPTAGEGTCLGYDILRQQREIRQQVGYMTQRFTLYEDLTVEENMRFVARLFKMPHWRDRVESVMKQMGLAQRRNQLAGQLSGGWKQRLALSCSLLHEPKLLLLDEPTAGVDPKARRDFWEEIQNLAEERGLTVLLTTHYMDEAERCHELMYLAYGKVLARGSVDELIHNSSVTVWMVTGPDLNALAMRLRKCPGLRQVVAFGNSLHVAAADGESIEHAFSICVPAGYTTAPIATGLEDVFIDMMERSAANR